MNEEDFDSSRDWLPFGTKEAMEAKPRLAAPLRLLPLYGAELRKISSVNCSPDVLKYRRASI